MFDKTQVKYGVALVLYGWRAFDCPLRRLALKVGKWLGLGVLALCFVFGAVDKLAPRDWDTALTVQSAR